MRIETVTSAANPLLKDLRRAVARGGLTSEGFCVAESFHLLEEALRSDCRVAAVLASDSVKALVERHVGGLRGPRTIVLPDPLFQSIAATETSQGVIALVQPPEWTVEQIFRGRSMVVVLDGVQDPGNAGAIVFGFGFHDLVAPLVQCGSGVDRGPPLPAAALESFGVLI